MNVYAKYFHKNSKNRTHLFKDEKILKKFLKLWNKIKSLIKKELKVNQCIMINTLKLE